MNVSISLKMGTEIDETELLWQIKAFDWTMAADIEENFAKKLIQWAKEAKCF